MRIWFMAAAALLSANIATAAEKPAEAQKRLLVITQSAGFVHGVVKRPNENELSLAEKTLVEIGNKNNIDVVCSQNAREMITAENLAKFDGLFFYTTGDLKLSDTQKADMLGWIKSGKGFAGSHCATDTYYNWPEYGNLIGAYFDGHPWHTKVTVIVEDTKHPSTKHLGDSFVITDEIYQFRDPYSRDKLHILMKLDPKWTAEQRDNEQKKLEEDKKKLLAEAAKLEADGKAEEAKKKTKEAENRRGGIHRTDNDFAVAWTREYGKGRVFYTSLGHRDEVWKDERFQQHMLGGLRYVLGLEKADAKPSGSK